MSIIFIIDHIPNYNDRTVYERRKVLEKNGVSLKESFVENGRESVYYVWRFDE